VQPAANTRPLADVLDSAGIPEANKTDTGVTIPAGFDVTTPKLFDGNDLMDKAGVPGKYQGDIVARRRVC
jgi:hypothetical protein